MFRDLLSSRMIQGGLAFFVLVVGGSLFYSWHGQRTTEIELARHDPFLKGREKQNETRPAEAVNDPTESKPPGFVNTPDENTGTLMSDTTEVFENETDALADAFLPEDFVSEEAPAEEGPVSPYGFGPYPEVPEDLPLREKPFDWTSKNVEAELLMRVILTYSPC
ncbi:MAG: hypothetical protein OXU51_12805 [Candidatus Poribacteria bacterium]|nr:hypothetical protein [Candidatus Poribacteria bacterium]